MNLNSGVGDNAAGRYFGARGGGRGSGMSSRQMRQYMQMRRDEMSHGAYLANQNDSLKSDRDENRGQREADKEFNRTSLRTDANVQQDDWTANRDTARNDWTAGRDTLRQDWSRGRARGHLTGMAADNPHLTNVNLDSASASFNPGFAPAGGGSSGGPRNVPSVQVDPPAGGGPKAIAAPVKVKSTRMSAKAMQARVDSGELSQAEAAAAHRGYAARVGRDRADDNAGKPPAPIRGGVEYVAGVGSKAQFGGTTAGGSGVGSRKSGNPLDEVTGPTNPAGTGRTDLPTKFF